MPPATVESIDRERVFEAFRNADKAGDTAVAQRMADYIREKYIGALPSGSSPQIPTESDPMGLRIPSKQEPTPPSLMDRLSGAAETGASMLAEGMIGIPSAAVAGLGGLAMGDPEMAKRAAAAQLARWAPRTETGQQYSEKIGELAQSLGPAGTPAALAGIPAAATGAARVAPIAGRVAGNVTEGAAATARMAREAMPSMPVIRDKTAMDRLRQQVGSVPSRIRTDTEGQVGRLTDEHAAASREAARLEDLARNPGKTEYQVKANAKEASGILHKQAFGDTREEGAIGGDLKAKLAAEKEAAYKARSEASEAAYRESADVAAELERYGRSFGQSDQGKATIKSLKSLIATKNGLETATEAQRKAVNDLIEAIRGRPESTKTEARGGASMRRLQAEVRSLRRVDEGNAPAENFAALKKEEAHEILRALLGEDENGNLIENSGLYAWNPKYAEADKAHRTATSALEQRFGPEKMRSVLRGEKADFRQMAIDPSDLPAQVFTSRKSVADLKAATNDPALVSKAAKEFAAAKLRGMPAEKASGWISQNRDWLDEAGVLKDTEAYAQKLSRHETRTANALTALKHRSETIGAEQKEFAKSAESAKSKIGELTTSRESMARDFENTLKHARPGNLLKAFDTSMRPRLESTGLFSREELDQIAQQLEQADKTGRAFSALKNAAYILGGHKAGHVFGLTMK